MERYGYSFWHAYQWQEEEEVIEIYEQHQIHIIILYSGMGGGGRGGGRGGGGKGGGGKGGGGMGGGWGGGRAVASSSIGMKGGGSGYIIVSSYRLESSLRIN